MVCTKLRICRKSGYSGIFRSHLIDDNLSYRIFNLKYVIDNIAKTMICSSFFAVLIFNCNIYCGIFINAFYI